MIGRLVVMVVALAGGTTAKLWGADPPERVAITAVPTASEAVPQR